MTTPKPIPPETVHDTHEPEDSLANYVQDQPTTWEVKRWALQQAYLAQYAETGRVFESASIVGCTSEATESWHRLDSLGFQNRYAKAKEQFLEKCVAEIDRRAFQGIDHPVIHQGVITDTYKVFDSNLAMFRVKKLDPSYRENAQLVDGMVEVITVLDELRRIGTPRGLAPADTVTDAATDSGMEEPGDEAEPGQDITG